MSSRIASLLLVLPLMAACSLVKLSDKVGQAHCKTSADCDVLNDHKSSTFDPCELWQCAADSKLCEFGPLDADGDGYSPHTVSAGGQDLVCQAMTSKQDCDDGNASRNPGHAEVCDGVDNNCDGNVDEGVLQIGHDTAIVLGGANQQGVNDVSFAVDPASGTLGLGLSISRSPSNVPGIAKLANGLPSGGSVLEVKPPLQAAGQLPMIPQVLVTDSVGIGALGAEAFALAFYDRNGTHRVLAGSVELGAQTATLDAPSSTFIYGLSCEASESCHGNASAPATAIATGETATPAVAAQGDDVLVGYVRNPKNEDAEACVGKSAAITAKPVLANWLQKSNKEGLTEVSSEALRLGTTDGVNPPALLGIPPLGAKNQSFGWLVAYPDEAGVLQVFRVTTAGTKLVVSDALLTLEDKTQRLRLPQMTLGPVTDKGQLVGLVYQLGCSVDARVKSSVFELSLDASGNPHASGSTLNAAVGGGTAEMHPAISYSADRLSWGVVYRDTKGVRARVLDAQGKPVGDAPYTLVANGGSGASKTQVLLSPAITWLSNAADTGWFGALGYVDQGAGAQYAFASATLSSCQKK